MLHQNYFMYRYINFHARLPISITFFSRLTLYLGERDKFNLYYLAQATYIKIYTPYSSRDLLNSDTLLAVTHFRHLSTMYATKLYSALGNIHT